MFELLLLMTLRLGCDPAVVVEVGVVVDASPVVVLFVGDSGGSLSSLVNISWYCWRYGRNVAYEVMTDWTVSAKTSMFILEGSSGAGSVV